MTKHQATENRPKNHLAGETSPYLLQHVYNPVDWYPWGEEAFAKAKRENKAIFLSIGYSACHWCHVMEHESFESQAMADFLNEHFVSIKVDREERPDVDDIYMKAVIAFTGQGGWPMTVFMTPDRKPFFGGTYFPPEPRHGMPSFMMLCERILKAWKEQRDEIETNAQKMAEHLQKSMTAMAPGNVPPDIAERLADDCLRGYDDVYGGFSQAPKFFHSGEMLACLLDGRDESIKAVHHTLTQIARGGITDQIGGGLHRYSVDEKWLVPHFEKMLYDQALVLDRYVDMARLSQDPLMDEMVASIAGFVNGEFLSPENLYHTSTDADSEGEEGLFFIWKPDEVMEVLGKEDAQKAQVMFGLDQHPNFEGQTILTRPDDEEASQALGLDQADYRSERQRIAQRLVKHRSKRVPPGEDDKVLSDWNGLMIAALARAARYTDRQDWKQQVNLSLQAIEKHMMVDGRLKRTRREGNTHLDAVATDHVYLSRAYLEAFILNGDFNFLEQSLDLMERAIKHYSTEEGPFTTVAKDGERLIADAIDTQDGALPSSNGVAADTLFRLALFCERDDFRDLAEKIVKSYGQVLDRYPRAAVTLALAWLRGINAHPVVIVTGNDPEARAEMTAAARRIWLGLGEVLNIAPDQVAEKEKLMPYLKGKLSSDEAAVAYVCRGQTCLAPISDTQELIKILSSQK